MLADAEGAAGESAGTRFRTLGVELHASTERWHFYTPLLIGHELT